MKTLAQYIVTPFVLLVGLVIVVPLVLIAGFYYE